MLSEIPPLVPPLALGIVFFLAAAIYSSVGHGGASAYLALMGLLGMAPAEMKPIALTLNIAISGVALVSFIRAGHFQKNLFLPLAAASVPAAFLGGWLQAPDSLFKVVLAAALIIGAWRLAFGRAEEDQPLRPTRLPTLIVLGFSIGLVSGLVGIGGGIFLTPLLVLFRWSTARPAAAVSAAFILANSCSGIAGFMMQGGSIPSLVWMLLPSVLLGAWIGSRWGSGSAPIPALRNALAVVLVVAAAKFTIL